MTIDVPRFMTRRPLDVTPVAARRAGDSEADASWPGGEVVSRMSPHSDGDGRSVELGNLARMGGNGPAQAQRIRDRDPRVDRRRRPLPQRRRYIRPSSARASAYSMKRLLP